MNVDEFLRQTEELADEREGASPHRVYKLLALVRKLREQRDSGRILNIDPEEWQDMKTEFNAALDDIVREG